MNTKIIHILDQAQVIAMYRLIDDISPYQMDIESIMRAFLLMEIKRKLKSKLVDEKSRYKLQINLAQAIVLNDWLMAIHSSQGDWMDALIIRVFSDNDKFIKSFMVGDKHDLS